MRIPSALFCSVFLLGSSGAANIIPPLEATQRIEDTRVVRRGKDTLTYRLVTPPPQRRVVPATIAPQALPSQPEPEEEAIENWLNFTYTVTPYPKNVSEVKWLDEHGRTKRVFVHEDLTYLEVSLFFAVDGLGLSYSIFGYGSSASLPFGTLPTSYRRAINSAAQLPLGQFIQVPAEDGKLSPVSQVETDALDVLLDYYLSNKEELKKRFLENQAAALKAAEAQRIEDAKPKNIEIRYWPVKSQRYNTATR